MQHFQHRHPAVLCQPREGDAILHLVVAHVDTGSVGTVPIGSSPCWSGWGGWGDEIRGSDPGLSGLALDRE
jgi:hypothetical protein